MTSVAQAKHDNLKIGLAKTDGPKVDDAKERLEGALAKLESAIDSRVRGDGVKLDQMNAELERLRRENAALEQLTGQIEARLESAIRRLKSVLET